MSAKDHDDLSVMTRLELLPHLLTRGISATFDFGFGLCCAASESGAGTKRTGEEAGAGVETEGKGADCKTSASELSLSLRGASFSRRVKEERDLGRTMADCCWMAPSLQVHKATTQRLA